LRGGENKGYILSESFNQQYNLYKKEDI